MMDPPLVSVLVLHPICATLAVLCSVLSLIQNSRPSSTAAMSLSIWNGILVTIAFAADVAVVLTAKARVDSGSVIVYWGAGPWMTLAAAICTWTAAVLLSIRAWNYGKNPNPNPYPMGVAGRSPSHKS